MNWEVPPLPPIFWNWKWTKFYFKRNFYNPFYLKDPTTTSNQEKHPLSGDPPPQQTGWQSTCTPRRWRRTTSPGTTCWPGSTSRSTPASQRSRRCAAAPRIASSWTCSFPVSFCICECGPQKGVRDDCFGSVHSMSCGWQSWHDIGCTEDQVFNVSQQHNFVDLICWSNKS